MSDGELKSFTLLPGFDKNNTDLTNEGRVVDGDKVRVRYGKFEKIGGWLKQQLTQADNSVSTLITGVPRDIHTWQSNDTLNDYIALGTHEKVEFIKDNIIYDMTPIATITTVTNAITTSTGSNVIIASVTAHGGVIGDYFIIGSAATSVGGLDFSGQYVITSTPGADSFWFEHTSAATATSTAAGGDFTFSFLLETGKQSNDFAYGYGADVYNALAASTTGFRAWNQPASTTDTLVNMRQWTLQSWGEDILATPRGGRIYWWDRDTSVESALENRSDVRLQIITASPTVNNGILVTPERFVLSYGTTDLNGNFDPLLVRWCSQEDFNTWDPTASVFGGNTAGEQRLRGGNEIIGAANTKNETIIFTDDVVHSMAFVGDPTVFSFREVGDGSGLISPHGVIDVNGTLYWMGKTAFYQYRGIQQVLPCTLQKAIFDKDSDISINKDQTFKVFCGRNTEFNEIIWLYPSRDSTENDRYVIFNYLENTWVDGTIVRTVWEDAGIFENPIGGCNSGYLYSHEEGKNNDTSPLVATMESGWVDLKDGQEFMFIDRFVPDFKDIPNNKSITVTIQTKKYPQDTEIFTKGPYTITNATRKIDFRARGRVAKVTYTCSVLDGDFQCGSSRIRLMPDGER